MEYPRTSLLYSMSMYLGKDQAGAVGIAAGIGGTCSSRPVLYVHLLDILACLGLM